MESMKTSPTGAETKTWITAVLLGWLSLTIGLYAATAAGRLLKLAGANVIVVQLSKGGIISSISLAAVYYIQTRLLGRAWSDIVGDRLRKGIVHLLIGAGLAVGLAGFGFIIACWQGWIGIAQWHLSPELLGSIAVNIMFAFLYEALPEETVLRGFAYSTLRLKLPALAAFPLQLAMFVLVPVAVACLQRLSGMGMATQMNAEYVILLLCFGTALQLLRIATGSLWAPIGFHLAYLEISRFAVLQREQRLFTYHETMPGTGELFILFFMTVVVAALILACMLTVRRIRAKKR
ncbi:CPBP family glutamic-type intramembrane protease [Paenibacillus sp. FSL M7-1455]|uniref:CPBP family glutamic-type intramembrane protease n=1 Tax=Paenibacillus sp. FSL M7-1455 TaxID=2975316 RepID=UPI0030FB031B